MKKLLGAVLALAFVVVTSQANAELLKNFKFNGSVEMNATSARNVTDFNTKTADRVGAAQTRVMLGMDWDLLDDVHSKVSLYKNDQVYGQAGGDASGAQSVTTIQTVLFASQAYFKIDKVFGFVDATFGRQYYGEAGDLIAAYGPKVNEYGMRVTSIDGARFDWAGEKAYVTALAFRPVNAVNLIGAIAPTNQADIRAFMAGNKGNENVDAKVSLWNQATHIVTGGFSQPNDNLYIADVKVKGKAAGAYGSVEVAYNFGENRNAVNNAKYDGKAILADLGYKVDVEQIGTINPWGQFGYGSGNGDTAATPNAHNEDFQSIATDYRPGAIYGRFDGAVAGMTLDSNANISSGNGLTNRIIWGVGVKATPKALSKLTAGVAYYDFNLAKLTPYAPLVAGVAGNRHIGSEFDVTGEWKHSENVSLVGTIGDFQTGGLINNLNAGKGNNPALMTAFDVCVKF